MSSDREIVKITRTPLPRAIGDTSALSEVIGADASGMRASGDSK